MGREGGEKALGQVLVHHPPPPPPHSRAFQSVWEIIAQYQLQHFGFLQNVSQKVLPYLTSRVRYSFSSVTEKFHALG